MCGIAGRVGPSAGYSAPLKRMTDSITHRGPDEEGLFFAPGVELGSRRLAIIDIAEGQQPVSINQGRVTVVFNGEIYNFRELRKVLLDGGHLLSTHSDTEVIAWMYLRDGMSFVNHLRGMFAIAIWDAREQKLILIRDRLGKKPILFRERSDSGIDFASEVKALLAVGASREPDLQSLDFVMAFGYTPPPMTGFKNISALPPAHFLVWKNGKTTIERYWKFRSSVKSIFDPQDAISQTKEILEESVKLRLVSERPIGVLLSGGIDSTLVAAYAARNLSTKLNTFSIGFEDPKFDESRHAAQVAKILGTNHHQLIIKPDPELLVRTMSKTLDRPFADSSILPTYIVSEYARSEVVVALGGDGGDEVFGGYSRYLILDRMQRVNQLLGIAKPLGFLINKLAHETGSQSLSRLAGGFRTYPTKRERYQALVSLIQKDERQALWDGRNIADGTLNNPAAWFSNVWENVDSQAGLDHQLAVDIETYLPEDLNFKTDIASMANGLELRSPFQDHVLVELGGRISETAKFHDGQTKYILRKIAKEFVPPAIVDRRKMGFGIPRARWMREELRPLVTETLLGSNARNRGWFDQNTVKNEITLHNSGIDRDRILWPLFAIELWAQNWSD